MGEAKNYLFKKHLSLCVPTAESRPKTHFDHTGTAIINKLNINEEEPFFV